MMMMLIRDEDEPIWKLPDWIEAHLSCYLWNFHGKNRGIESKRERENQVR